MKFTETIIQSTIKYIPTLIFGILGILIGSIYFEVIPVILPSLIQQLPKTLLLKILSVLSIVFLLLSLVTFALSLKLRNKLTPKFGILWDKSKEPYCPSCSQPLAKYIGSNIRYRPNLNCNKCNKELSLATDDGERINITEAKKLL